MGRILVNIYSLTNKMKLFKKKDTEQNRLNASLRGRVPGIISDMFYRSSEEDDERDREIRRLELEEARAKVKARKEEEEARQRELAIEVERVHDEANAMKAREKIESDAAYEESERMMEEEKYNKSFRGKASKVWSKFKGKKSGDDGMGQEQKSKPEAQESPSGGSTFSPKILIEQHQSKLKWVLLILILALLGAIYQFGWEAVKSFMMKHVLSILFFLIWAIVLLWAFVTDKNKTTAVVVAIPYILWLIDSTTLFGPPYQGFKFQLSLLTETNWVAVLTSSLISALLIFNIFNEFFNRDLGFIASMFLFALINYISAWFLPTSTAAVYPIFPIVIAAFGILLWFIFRRQGFTFHPETLSYLFMVLVFSYFWVNWNWTTNNKAVLHVMWILIFSLGYLGLILNVDKTRVYFFTSLALIIDFFFYSISFDPQKKLTYPIIVVLTSFYAWKLPKEPSRFAVVNIFLVMILFSWITYTPAYGADLSVDFEEQTPEGPTGIIPTFKTWLQAFERKISGTVGERIDVATGGYSGLVEQNQYESLGVYFADPRAGEPKFYPGQPVTVWATIRSKTYQDPVIIENFGCEVRDTNKNILSEAKIKVPSQPLAVFKLEENDVRCTFENGLNPGTNQVTLFANYNFATNAYMKAYFIDRETYREMVRENLDPLIEFGIQDKQPKPVFTNGPISIGMDIGPLIYVVQKGTITGTGIPPRLEVFIQNRQAIEDKDKRIISQWEGSINKINELIILTPPDVTISAPESCRETVDPRICPCNRPIRTYGVADCRNSCAEVQKKCNGACKDSAGNEDKGCIKECDRTFNSCNEDCDNLFRVSPGEGPEKEIYNGYSLNVNASGYINEYENIAGDKYASFSCDLTPQYEVLDNKQLATRYFRVRVRYDYKLENTIQVQVEQVAGLIRTDIRNLIDMFSAKYTNLPTPLTPPDKIEPNLVRALVNQESFGGIHCCQERNPTKGLICTPSGDRTCRDDRILTSFDGSSIGIMQINVRDDPNPRRRGHPEWKTDASAICGNNPDGTPKTVYDLECNIELGIKILRESYDTNKDGKDLVCYDRNGNKIFSERYTNWDAAIRGYVGWGCSSDNCDDACLKRVRGYVPSVNNYKKMFDDNLLDLAVEKATQEKGYIIRSEPLEPPSNAKAEDTLGVDRSITISWQESPTPNVQYRIYRYKTGSTTPEVQSVTITELSYVDTRGLVDDEKYYYRITALRGSEQSTSVQTNEVTPIKDAPSGTP